MDNFICIWAAFRRALGLLQRNDPLILCSSTAFFATFSLSPILILLVHLFSLYFTSEKIGYQMFQAIASTFGPETARDIEKIVGNFMELRSGWLITIVSSIFFVFVATTLLTVVKKAIHKLWHIRSKPEWHLRYFGWERGTAILLILISGILLLLSILVDTGLAVSRDYLATVWPGAAIFAIEVLNVIFSIVVITVWFTLIFKILPEAHVQWDVAFVGGLLTSLLYSFGQFVLGKVLIHARLETIFGATTSLALILLFIFYCSFILYFGAAFTYEYAQRIDQPIQTNRHSRMYEEKLLETT
ncbi:MAG TPA: YihY/virulence factor BrkB family protein [Chryseosolibacter sp.]|nr:YihY/virulence factor BrkB family protein [Chryseosolibacter sp.]